MTICIFYIYFKNSAEWSKEGDHRIFGKLISTMISMCVLYFKNSAEWSSGRSSDPRARIYDLINRIIVRGMQTAYKRVEKDGSMFSITCETAVSWRMYTSPA